MRHLLSLLLVPAFVVSHAQPFDWQWSRAGTGNLMEPLVVDMAVDADGNAYLVGNFYGTITYGSLPSAIAVGQSDVFVVKYAPDGTPLWLAQGGGSSWEEATGIAVDTAGNAYITGSTSSPTADFGSTTLSLQGTMDVVVAKLNSSGQWQWAKHFGSNYTGDEAGQDIVATADGGTYITGAFKYYFELDALPDLEGCSATQDLFLLHLDTEGTPVWARNPDCTRDASYGLSTGQQLELDGQGNLYLGARFRGDTCFFGNDTLPNAQTSGQTNDCLLAKYSLGGDLQWVRWIGGYGYDDVTDIAADAAGNCYVALKREDEYYLPEFQIPVSGSAGIYRAVLLNVSPTGGFLSWKRFGNSSYEHRVNRVHVDAENDVLLTGWFEDRFEFDAVVFEGNGPYHGSFLARFANNGTVEEVFATRSNAPRRFMAMDLDDADNLYLAGGFADTLTFPGTPTLDVVNTGAFLARSGDLTNGLAPVPLQEAPRVFPSPSQGTFAVRHTAPFGTVRIWNATGALVVEERFAPTLVYELQGLEPGAYTVGIAMADGTTFRTPALVVR